jgi:hypothetical protein
MEKICMSTQQLTPQQSQALDTLSGYFSQAKPDTSGKFQIGEFTKSVTIKTAEGGAKAEASVAQKVSTLADCMIQVRGRGNDLRGLSRLSPEQKKNLYQTAQTLWESALFKTLTKEQRNAINDIRWVCGTTKQNAKDIILNFLASCRDLIMGTRGLQEGHKELLFSALNNVESAVKEKSFKRITDEIAAMEKAFGNVLSQTKGTSDVKHLQRYVADFITESRAALKREEALRKEPEEKAPEPPKEPEKKAPEPPKETAKQREPLFEEEEGEPVHERLRTAGLLHSMEESTTARGTAQVPQQPAKTEEKHDMPLPASEAQLQPASQGPEPQAPQREPSKTEEKHDEPLPSSGAQPKPAPQKPASETPSPEERLPRWHGGM